MHARDNFKGSLFVSLRFLYLVAMATYGTERVIGVTPSCSPLYLHYTYSNLFKDMHILYHYVADI